MGVALLNRHRGSTRVGRSGVARTHRLSPYMRDGGLADIAVWRSCDEVRRADDARHNYVLHGMAVCRHRASRRDRKLDGRHAAEPSSEEMVDSEISVTRAKSVQPR